MYIRIYFAFLCCGLLFLSLMFAVVIDVIDVAVFAFVVVVVVVVLSCILL